MQRLTFNQFRKANKLGVAATAIVVFKASVGMGLFSYPFAMGKVGYIYGILLSLLVSYLTSYGMACLCSVANKVEKAKFGLKKMHQYQGNGFLF